MKLILNGDTNHKQTYASLILQAMMDNTLIHIVVKVGEQQDAITDEVRKVIHEINAVVVLSNGSWSNWSIQLYKES